MFYMAITKLHTLLVYYTMFNLLEFSISLIFCSLIILLNLDGLSRYIKITQNIAIITFIYQSLVLVECLFSELDSAMAEITINLHMTTPVSIEFLVYCSVALLNNLSAKSHVLSITTILFC